MNRTFSTDGWRAIGPIIVFLGIVAIFGGASRPDALSQVAVRLAAVALIAWQLARYGFDRRFAGPGAVLACIAAVPILQLVPLPTNLWQALPGRQPFIDALAAARIDAGWRPVSLSPDLTWNALFALLPPAAAALALATLDREQRAAIVPILLMIVAASAVLGVAQLAGGSATALRYYAIHSDGATGFFANRNHAALLSALGLPLLAAWALPRRGEQSRRRAWIGGALALMLVSLLPATGSRAGIVLGGLGLIGAAFIVARQGAVPRKTLIIGGGSVAALITALVGLTAWLRPTAFERWGADGGVDELRIQLLPVLGDMARTFMPFGSGMGTFYRVVPRFERIEDLRPTYLNAAHNDVLQLLIEGGVLAALLAVASLIWVSIASARAWRRQGRGSQIGQAASIAVLLLLLASIVDYPLRTPLHATILAIAVWWLRDAGDKAFTSGEADRRAEREHNPDLRTV